MVSIIQAPSQLKGNFELEDKHVDLSTPYNLTATFEQGEVENLQINATGFSGLSFGQTSFIFGQDIKPLSFNSNTFSTPKIFNKKQYIKPAGYLATLYSKNTAWNYNKEVKPQGFLSTILSNQKIYNFKQVVNVRGYDTPLFGNTQFFGGVRYINLNAINSSIIPKPLIINTRADQYVNIQGLVAPVLPQPSVSPRVIYSIGSLSLGFGSVLVQRNPSPKGFTTDHYGKAWLSHSPRSILPVQFEGFLAGHVTIFDPVQHIRFNGLGLIHGGVFGDIALKNKNRFTHPNGFNSQDFGNWSIVESNKRSIYLNGFDASVFSKHNIKNVSLGIAVSGFKATQGLDLHIAYKIRNIKTRGVDLSALGLALLSKTPVLNTKGFDLQAFGKTTISNYRRIIEPLPWESLKADDAVVWHYVRDLKIEPIYGSEYGNNYIEHGRRLLLATGTIYSSYGTAWVSFYQRKLTPNGIAQSGIPIHQVGRNQQIIVGGFIATKFGDRIIPILQAIYPQGFANSYGNALVQLWKRYVKPIGSMSTGQEGAYRFGVSKFWNKRQYIKQNFDPNNGLVPPTWIGWTSIHLRNKTLRTIGSQHSRFGLLNIENKARLLHPISFNNFSTGNLLIADRVRYLRMQGIESPYISGWHGLYNEARVLSAKGDLQQVFGISKVVNTRRYFNRIGNLQSLDFGLPMISDRIRYIEFEHRYRIAPPIIRLPIVDLHTRYIDEVGMRGEPQIFGHPELSIRWKKLTPRWVHRDYIGEPSVRNLTPEIKQRGNVTTEFGTAYLRLKWFFLHLDGYGAELWGKTTIAFRDRTMHVKGVNYIQIGVHRIIRMGAPPYSLQAIDLSGYGIAVDVGHVPLPSLKSNVIYTEGFIASRFGAHHTQSNGILIKSGIQEFSIGNHIVSVKNRAIQVPTLGDLLQLEKVKPRLSPHTIYAVMEASSQAINNNPVSGNLHYVNSNAGNGEPGEVFGSVVVANQHGKISVFGDESNQISPPIMSLLKRYIKPEPIASFRSGWHLCLDGSPQYIEQYDSESTSLYGRPSVQSVHFGPYKLAVPGFSALIIGNAHIEHFNRILILRGFLSTQMGAGVPNDTPYKPQGLWVGKPMPTTTDGFNAELFGKTWVSLKVRDVSATGFDAFVSEMNVSNFKDRMKVILIKKPIIIDSKEIQHSSLDSATYGVPNIRLAVHYIRPDGNSEQYRKGAPQ